MTFGQWHLSICQLSSRIKYYTENKRYLNHRRTYEKDICSEFNILVETPLNMSNSYSEKNIYTLEYSSEKYDRGTC